MTSGTNEGKIYFKTADTSGEWSEGIQFTAYGVSFQYSANGTSWHTTAADTDYYIRFSSDNGTTWSSACAFRGKSAYAYTGYASDTSGNDFSLEPSSSLTYWNWIRTDTPIETAQLTAAKFASDGDGWAKRLGSDGVSYEWHSGSGAPDAALGKNGDWYINVANCDIYTKISGSWTNKLNIKGTTGAGITLRGGWDISTTYSAADGVTYEGNFYISSTSNTGAAPDTSTSDWTLYVAKGETGALPEITQWNATTAYSRLDCVVYEGSTYQVTASGGTSAGDLPTDTTKFIKISNAGISGNVPMTFNSLTDGHAVFSSEYAVIAVKAPSGKIHQVENGDLSFSDGETLLDMTRYLIYENAASFSGEWTAYFASGKDGEQGIQGQPGVQGAKGDKGDKGDSSINQAWTTISYEASISLNVASGSQQKITMSGDLSLTSPTLTSSNSTLLLQIAINRTNSSILRINGNIIQHNGIGTYLIGWYYDGATTRRSVLQEVV